MGAALMPPGPRLSAAERNREGRATGYIIVCPRCDLEHRHPVAPVHLVEDARRDARECAALIREVSDEVVLVPVATLNAIAERAERAEARVRALEGRLHGA